jgi:BirA family transcriptional regulator, biotin operon repressor / biotin---[acetyl-CoA-carboxylase] ligase
MIIGSNLLFFENLPSTNIHAAELIRKKSLPEGTIVYANYQSAGKGHAENSWESERDKNLLISIILHPSFLIPAEQYYISMSVSLGVCDFLMRYIPDCTVKWPNDIYINDDKIAGILIENALMADRIEYSIAGIGLNINQEKFISPAPNPISLAIVTGRIFDLKQCLTELCICLDQRYKQLIARNLSAIKNEFESKMYRHNQWSEFRDNNGIFTGKITEVGDFGSLKIETKNGDQKQFSFKEVEFIL